MSAAVAAAAFSGAGGAVHRAAHLMAGRQR